jgi:hypothetical protein
MLKFPSVEDVAWELRALNSSANGLTTVYLQIFDDGKWWVHSEGSSVNTDEHCYFSQGEVPGCTPKRKKPRKFNSEEAAENLIEDIKKQYETNVNPT